MRRPRPRAPDEDRPGPALLRSGLKGIGAVALGVVVIAAVAAAITFVVAAVT